MKCIYTSSDRRSLIYFVLSNQLILCNYEGTFGVLTLAVLLWPMYFITIPKDGVLGGIALGPDGRSALNLF